MSDHFSDCDEPERCWTERNLFQRAEYGTVWVYHVPEAKLARKAQSVDFTCADTMNQLLGRE